MNNFDEKLKQALDSGNPIDFDRDEDLLEMTAQVFRSKLRWAVVVLWIEGLIITLVAIWAGVRLYHAQEIKPLIVYATVLILCAVTLSLIKLIGWQWMNKYSLMREIKRLELRIIEMHGRK